jgi:hypothetical protein
MKKNQRVALAEKNLKVKDLGVILDLHPGYISSVLAGHYKSQATRQNIAKVLGKPKSFLWPENASDDVDLSTK